MADRIVSKDFANGRLTVVGETTIGGKPVQETFIATQAVEADWPLGPNGPMTRWIHGLNSLESAVAKITEGPVTLPPPTESPVVTDPAAAAWLADYARALKVVLLIGNGVAIGGDTDVQALKKRLQVNFRYAYLDLV